MKVKVISISDSDKHFASAIQEYCKRLGKDVDMVDIKPEKNGPREQIIKKETEKIVSKLEGKDSHVILLLKEGKQFTTEQFVKSVEKNNNLTFVIGGPYGIDLPLLQSHTNTTISFGSMTMPHGLAKLVLLEQIYRAKMIMEGREYHY